MTSIHLATRSVVPPIASPADECSAHVKSQTITRRRMR